MFYWLFIFLLIFSNCYAQELVKYDKNFKFKDGVYLTFEEFKNNSPSITKFQIQRTSQFSNNIEIKAVCFDTVKKTEFPCIVNSCWGYVQNNAVYIYQGFGSSFYRLHIIGALLHYYAIELEYDFFYDYNYSFYTYNTYRPRTRTNVREYIVEFQTGNKIEFNYRNFSEYLKVNDVELYNELKNSKNRRKMIYFYLLKYNERHPIYFPK